MKKKILSVVLGLTLCFGMTGCANKHETITINSYDDFIFDDITISLKEGYWVRDYNIDYENGVVTLNLDKD
jgi:hypothetical protein